MGVFIVVGLGNFGFNAVRALKERGHQVIAVDRDKSVVQAVKPYAVQAIEGDASDKDIFRALGLEGVDAGIVSLGEKMEASMLVAMYLKDLGVRHLIVKAFTEDHARILRKIGVDEVILPEKDMACSLVERLSAPSILGEFHILKGYSILDTRTPKQFLGKTLGDIDLRNRFGVSVILIQRGTEVLTGPCAEDVVLEGDIMVLLGKDEEIEAFKRFSQSKK
jgi:trk system potassium uptake protein TrkA